MIDTSEKNFEATIEASLLNSGYQRRSSKDYERSLCLIPEDVLNFIQTSQPQEWQKFQTQYGDDANTQLLKQLAEVIKNRGTLEVLRKGIKPTAAASNSPTSNPPAVSIRKPKNSTRPTALVSLDNCTTARKIPSTASILSSFLTVYPSSPPN